MDRALLISTENPFPADSGGRLRLRGIVEVLAQRFALDLLTYDRPGHADLEQARDRLNVIQVSRTVSRGLAALRSFYRRRPAGYMGHADLDMLEPARALCRTSTYHTVVVDNTQLGYFLPVLRRLQPGARLVVLAHNFETGLCEQLAAWQPPGPRRALFAWSARQTRRHETEVCRQADLLVCTSPGEAAAFAALHPPVAARTVVVPSCLDARRYAAFRRMTPRPATLVFPGDMAYFPNVAGARFFADAVLPLVRRRVPQVSLRLVGRTPHPSLVSLAAADPGIVVTGAVDLAAAHIAEGQVVVVPLLHGSGTRLKILEAWAVDRPVVSTAKGCEGLLCRDGDELLVADRPEAFAAAVCRLLDDQALAGRLVRRARHTLLTHYDVRVLPAALAAIVGDEAGQTGGRHAARPVA